jgi:hypothetical protein
MPTKIKRSIFIGIIIIILVTASFLLIKKYTTVTTNEVELSKIATTTTTPEVKVYPMLELIPFVDKTIYVDNLKIDMRIPETFKLTQSEPEEWITWDSSGETLKAINTGILYPNLTFNDSYAIEINFHNLKTSKHYTAAPTDAGENVIRWDGESLDTICNNKGFLKDSYLADGTYTVTSCIHKKVSNEPGNVNYTERIELTGVVAGDQFGMTLEEVAEDEQIYPFKIVYFKTPDKLWKGVTLSISVLRYWGDINKGPYYNGNKGKFYDDFELYEKILPTIKFETVSK